MYTVDDKEFAALLERDGATRYKYFVKRVVDNQVVWGIRGSEGWEMVGDESGIQAMPVWPHERFAQAAASGHVSGSSPTPITLDAWLENWLPGLVEDGKQVAVFPRPDGKGVVVSPQRLREDLLAELEKYE